MNKETTRLTVRQYESVKIIFNPLKDVSKSLISLTGSTPELVLDKKVDTNS